MLYVVSRYVKSSLAEVVVRSSQSRRSCLELSCCCSGNLSLAYQVCWKVSLSVIVAL